jgi:hypothetical protein
MTMVVSIIAVSLLITAGTCGRSGGSKAGGGDPEGSSWARRGSGKGYRRAR